jgi:hypothetical protein
MKRNYRGREEDVPWLSGVVASLRLTGSPCRD